MGGRFASEDEIREAQRLERDFEPQLFENAAAVQKHCAEQVISFRRSMAERFRELADEAEAKALREADVIDQELLIREAATWRWAAAIEDVPEEVVA